MLESQLSALGASAGCIGCTAQARCPGLILRGSGRPAKRGRKTLAEALGPLAAASYRECPGRLGLARRCPKPQQQLSASFRSPNRNTSTRSMPQCQGSPAPDPLQHLHSTRSVDSQVSGPKGCMLAANLLQHQLNCTPCLNMGTRRLQRREEGLLLTSTGRGRLFWSAAQMPQRGPPPRHCGQSGQHRLPS